MPYLSVTHEAWLKYCQCLYSYILFFSRYIRHWALIHSMLSVSKTVHAFFSVTPKTLQLYMPTLILTLQ